GVREYWIVDPEKKSVTVYQFEKESVEQYSFGDNIPVGIYEGFSIPADFR
ncbi:MAG TPA: Uma2 family endonuclease, partial [Lachnospiraceae bacterium]|nr:Uma2 family endonuclease [Lachnospiraceae bacterium]